MLYSNIDQFLNKREDLCMAIAGNEPDIIMLTEVIPKAQRSPIASVLLSIPNYCLFTSFNPESENLGSSGERGISIYVRCNLHATSVSFPASGFKESLWVKVRLRSHHCLLVGCIYRSPSGDGHQSMRQFGQMMRHVRTLSPSHLLVTGDFNFPQIDWKREFSNASEAHPSHELLEIMREYFLFQHVQEPTRYRHGDCSNTLDLVFTNEEGMIKNLQYLPGIGKSDHISLQFSLMCHAMRKKDIIPKQNFKRADFVSLNQLLASVNWNSMDQCSAEDAYLFLMKTLNTAMDRYIPKSQKKTNRKNIYMTSSALNLKQKKRALARTYHQTQDIIDLARLNNCEQKLRSLTRKLQREHEHALVANIKQNPKSFWRYTGSRMKTRVGVDDLMDDSGCLAADDSKKAEILNQQFSKVFTKEKKEAMPDFPVRCDHDILSDVTISPLIVRKKLASIKTSSSPGPDNLHPRVLQEAASSLCVPLSKLFRRSLDEGFFPSAWSLGSVTPVYKKGNKQDPANYRPISLTAIPCKILESIIRDELLGHLRRNNLLSNCQHGFRPRRSCETQLLEVLEDWSQLIETKSPVDAVYLDFSKAFDSVPHERLMMKLAGYGVRDKLLRWIKNFLSNRFQRVVVGSSFSDWAPVVSGVPQGSVLGPILFLVYINDLPDSVKSTIKIFADDTKIYSRANHGQSAHNLQLDIDHMLRWSELWQMPFNAGKCSILHIGNSNRSFDFTMNGALLQKTSSEKDLGVVIDKELKFKQQAASAVSRATRILAVIRRSFANIDKFIFPLLYKTMVRPHLEYGNSVWGPFNRRDQKLVEGVQRRATRMVRSLANLPYPERLSELDLPSLYYRRRRGDMIKVFQLLHGGVDQDPSLFLDLDRGGRTRGHAFKLVKPNAASRVRCFSFSVRIVNDWNTLPCHVVDSTTISQFKARLDAHWANQRYQVPHQD